MTMGEMGHVELPSDLDMKFTGTDSARAVAVLVRYRSRREQK